MLERTEIREVICNETKICYKFIRKEVKNINLRIKPNGEITVSANNTVSVEIVDDFVQRKQKFIFDALETYDISHRYIASNEKKYVSGENYYFLGKNLRLKVISGQKESVATDGVFLYLTLEKTDDFLKKQRMIMKWFAQMQELHVGEICMDVYKIFEKYQVKYPTIKYRYMKSRWGTCHPEKGIITLNSQLIEYPPSCIEYVVMHEFVHFLCRNHSREFYDYLTMFMPDWKNRKEELENLAKNY